MLWSPHLLNILCTEHCRETGNAEKWIELQLLPYYRCSLQNFSYNFEDAWFCSDKYNVLKNFDIYNFAGINTCDCHQAILRRKTTLLPATINSNSKVPFSIIFINGLTKASAILCSQVSLVACSKMWLYFENFVGGGGRFMIPQNILADSAPLPMHRIAYTSRVFSS
ncbi:hypothetical protein TNCV_969411 [Trichonephila clavipes]|nr:hypothetical protein TNCV_969411 [Trichonephila clavipes]